MGALADEAGNTQGQKAKGTKAAWDFDGRFVANHWDIFFDHYLFPLCLFPMFYEVQ